MALPAIGLGAAALLGGGTALGGIASAFGQNEAGKAQERAAKYAAEKAAEQKEIELAFNAGLSILGPELNWARDLAFTGFEAFDPAPSKVLDDRTERELIASGMSPDQVAWNRRLLGGFAGPSVAGKYRSQFNPMGA